MILGLIALITFGAYRLRVPPPVLEQNLAAGRPVQVSPTPNYKLRSGGGDPKVLTDGAFAPGLRLWTSPEALSWQGTQVELTVDLEQPAFISGASISTAFGTGEVAPPATVLVTVSTDGKTWRRFGAAPTVAWNVGTYTRTKISATGRGKARFVRFTIVPAGPHGFFACDELEVYPGPPVSTEGDRVKGGSSGSLAAQERILQGRARRVRSDLLEVHKFLTSAKVPEAARWRLRQLVDTISAVPRQSAAPDQPEISAILPSSPEERAIDLVYAQAMRSSGVTRPTVWKRHRYAWLGPHDAPGLNRSPTAIRLRILQGEVRSDAFLLTNPLDRPQQVSITSVNLQSASSSVQVAISPWTDTESGVAVAAALPFTQLSSTKTWTIQPGRTYRVWIRVEGKQLRSGRWNGALLVRVGLERLKVPFSLQVLPLKLQPTLLVTMWDYLNEPGRYSVPERAAEPLRRRMRLNRVDVPWATKSVLPWPSKDDFSASGDFFRRPTTDALRRWIRAWKGSPRMFVYVGAGKTFGGAMAGTSSFRSQVAAWARLIDEVARQEGLGPGQLGFLLIDEPSTAGEAALIAQWASAIKGAAPGLAIFEDPMWRNPASPEVHEAMKYTDVVCLLSRNLASYRHEPKSGKQLWIYETWDHPRTRDPERTYRLQGWLAASVAAKGLGFWSIADEGGVTSYATYLRDRPPYSLAYITPIAADDSIQWNALLEGVEDCDLFSMLLAATANTHDEKKARDLVRRALSRGLSLRSTERDNWLNKPGAQQLDQLREQIIDMLLLAKSPSRSGPRARPAP